MIAILPPFILSAGRAAAWSLLQSEADIEHGRRYCQTSFRMESRILHWGLSAFTMGVVLSALKLHNGSFYNSVLHCTEPVPHTPFPPDQYTDGNCCMVFHKLGAHLKLKDWNNRCDKYCSSTRNVSVSVLTAVIFFQTFSEGVSFGFVLNTGRII